MNRRLAAILVADVAGYSRLHVNWPGRRKRGAYFIRNIDGTKSDRNEFVWLDAGGLYPFSQAD